MFVVSIFFSPFFLDAFVCFYASIDSTGVILKSQTRQIGCTDQFFCPDAEAIGAVAQSPRE